MSCLLQCEVSQTRFSEPTTPSPPGTGVPAGDTAPRAPCGATSACGDGGAGYPRGGAPLGHTKGAGAAILLSPIPHGAGRMLRTRWAAPGTESGTARHGTAAKRAQDEFQHNNSPRAQGSDPAALPEGFPPCFTPLQLSKDAQGTGASWCIR